ncbi:carbohydrate binding family 9 domain-containing protein, partial [candidate division KSB1 bacterium]
MTFAVLCLALLGSAALGQQTGADRDYEVRSIGSVPAEEPPEIDGVLDEPVWSAADWQGEFRQLKPTVGDPAQVETRIAVAHDLEHLYVAFRCFNDPERPVYSRITRRDGNMDFDNAITLYLDTFHTRRDCYYFSTNSLGTQVDGRIGEDGRSNDKRWDCVWSVASREDSLGWTAEFAIPVKEIRFTEKGDGTWGVNFRRNYPELFEVGFWNYNDRRWQVSRFGDITGLPKFKGRRSFWVYPYLVGLNSNQSSQGLRPFYSTGNTEMMAGADVRFNIGANAVGNFTINPDFATVEGDQEVI